MTPWPSARRARVRTVRRLGLGLFLLAAAASRTEAQPALHIALGSARNAVSQIGESDSRRTIAAAIDANQLLFDERLRVFYSFDAGSFATAGDWSYREHTAGGTWRVPSDDPSRPVWFLGSTVLWRENGASWAAADYRGIGLFANTEWRFRPTAVLRAGYRADIRNFSDLGELDHVEHDGFASLLANLPSRTTLVGEFHLGAKAYDTSTTVPAAAVTGSEYAAAAGRGRGVGSGVREFGPGPVTAGSVDDRASRVLLLGRVAQSLTDRTGLSVEYTRRSTFGAVPAVLVTMPPQFFEDGVYDDPYREQCANRARQPEAAVPGRYADPGDRPGVVEGLPQTARLWA